MRSPKDFAEDLKEQVRKFREARDNADNSQIGNIHQQFRKLTSQFDAPGPRMRTITNFEIPDDRFPVPVRLYEPYNASKNPGPTLIYLHGGGFVTCDLESHEGICLRMASGSRFRVLSVNYRLAPKYPYPAGPDDCEKVLKWALSGQGKTYGIDSSRLGLGGDSAGGGLSLALLAWLLQSGSRPAGLFAFSPWTDLTLSGASLATNEATDAVLPRARMEELCETVLQGADRPFLG